MSAAGPPVDEPTATTAGAFEDRGVAATGAGGGGAAVRARPSSRARGCVITRIRETIRRVRRNRGDQSASESSPRGFSITSTAPAASALYVLNSSCRSADETTRIGVGWSAMMCSVACSPLIPGSIMSIVITSGRSRPVSSTACSPVTASPTTCSSGSSVRASRR